MSNFLINNSYVVVFSIEKRVLKVTFIRSNNFRISFSGSTLRFHGSCVRAKLSCCCPFHFTSLVLALRFWNSLLLYFYRVLGLSKSPYWQSILYINYVHAALVSQLLFLLLFISEKVVPLLSTTTILWKHLIENLIKDK